MSTTPLKPIKVVITKDTIEKFEQNPIHIGMNVIALLQRHGVPIVGALWPMGVTSGVLTSFYDEMFEEYVYEWKPE